MPKDSRQIILCGVFEQGLKAIKEKEKDDPA